MDKQCLTWNGTSGETKQTANNMTGSTTNVILPTYHISRHKATKVLYVRPGIDSKIRFSIEPLPGEEAFEQWRDAMKAVARLPLGIPTEFRKKVWLALADNYIKKLKIDWEQTKRLAFNDRSNPDDNRLGLQIVKDLHRTGCSGFSGTGNEQDRAVLKRVLLAYARWNKKVGYCQGFNVLAALLLDVMDRKEDDALKVMIYLVDYVLPESYFANNLRALSVDMAVFRDLLHIQLPQLSKHLDQLQTAARDDKTGANYEPPLTNVFTMQWFLTLFATCLPKPTALRVWDSVLLEGSEILLRTAVAIWGKLQKHIKLVQSADEFYTVMGTLSHKMLSCNMIEADSLIKMVYSMGPLPMPQLTELREKYTYNITPFTAAMSSEHTHVCSDDDDFDDDDFVENINCFGGMFPPQSAPPRALGEVDKARSGSSFDISKASPGAYAANPEELGPLASAYAERMSLDINQLKQQYKKLRQRQKQAHIILAAASARHYSFKHSSPASKEQKTPKHHSYVTPVQAPVAVNHLFIGRQQMRALRNNANLVEGTNIVKMHPENNGSITGQTWPASKKERQEAHLQQYRKTRQRGSVDSDDRQMEDRQAVNHQDKRSRSPSADSSISGTSTLKSSGSVSDVSTCGVESECPQSDTESSTSERLSGQDLIIFNDDEQGHQTPEGSTKQSDQVECQSSQENDSNNMDNKDKDSTKLECASSSDVDDADKDNNSSSVGDKEDTDHETELVTVDKNLIDANVAGQQTTEPARKENISKSSSPDTEQKHGMNTKQCASALDSVGKSPANGEKLREENKTNSDKMEVCYVTSLTYKGHKVVQAPNGKISTDGSSTCHDTATVHQDTNRQLNDSGLKSTNTPPGAIPDQPIKLFNPFPGQHVNSRRMKNGVKLGLYSANDIPRLKTGITKANMTKSQAHNVLQHRQYLARN